MSASEQAVAAEVMRTRIGAMTHLAPSGNLSRQDELESLQTVVDGCLDNWETRLVLDLTSVPLLDGKVLELLLGFQERLARVGGWLKLAHARPIVRDILEITGLTNTLTLMEASAEPVQRSNSGDKRRLGDILLEKGLISQERIEEAIKLQGKLGQRMGRIMIDRGWISEQALLTALSEQLSLSFVHLRPGLYDPQAVELLEPEVARRLKVLPLFKVRGILCLATSDPQAMASFGEVEERTSYRVRPVLAQQEDIFKALNDAYADSGYSGELVAELDDDFALVENNQPEDYSTIDEMAAGSPVINLVNSVIQRAVHDGASDIHIEPSRKKCRVRFRIDGLLYEVMAPRLELHPALVSRLKVMANLDIAERRLPQDGRIQVHTQGRSVDLRFSSLPGLYGEKVVLRVLDKNQAILDVDKLGMCAMNLSAFKRLLDRSYGLILVTGPTGSGKTTSLYAAINYLKSIEKNIVTIEDPVEYQVDIINQNEVKENIGLTFARMLKHVLRQDPDIVMVGEIREKETAEIAVQAALTGHLVLSTLHTNDSVGAVTRMIDMGVEPYLLSSALIGVVAQRLVRAICPACKTTFLAAPEVISRYGWEQRGTFRLAKGRGCPECYDSGYKGRMGVHEIVETDGPLQKLIISNPSRDQLSSYLQEHGSRLLFDDGLDRVVDGLTTIEEVSRVVNV